MNLVKKDKWIGADGCGNISREVRLLRSRREEEHGLVCVAMVLDHSGCDCSLKALRRRHPQFRRCMRLKDMLEVLTSNGLNCRALECNTENLASLRMPCIVHWDLRRFVVLEAFDGNLAVVVDPASGRERLNAFQFEWHYSGVALEIVPVGVGKPSTI